MGVAHRRTARRHSEESSNIDYVCHLWLRWMDARTWLGTGTRPERPVGSCANFVSSALPSGRCAATCSDRRLTESGDSHYVPCAVS
jgi:hypothetical protein